MEYRPEEARVTYFSKDRKEKESYDAPEWLPPWEATSRRDGL
jgi:hypothetical protein